MVYIAQHKESMIQYFCVLSSAPQRASGHRNVSVLIVTPVGILPLSLVFPVVDIIIWRGLNALLLQFPDKFKSMLV